MNSDAKELIIVEGLSAKSALNEALNHATQQVHAIQGKLINAQRASEREVLDDDVCKQLIELLGCQSGAHCDVSLLKFSRISICMDPDADGVHSSALLLTFFSRFLKPLVQHEKLFVIRVPLYSLSHEAYETQYAWSEQELVRLKSMAKQGSGALGADSPTIRRFKSIAQFSTAECAQLICDDSRRQFRLTA